MFTMQGCQGGLLDYVLSYINVISRSCALLVQSKGIIHLGATSCFVGDNTDIVQIKEALVLVRRKLVKLLEIMKTFAGT